MKRKLIAVFSALTMGISMLSATLNASSLTLIEQPTAAVSEKPENLEDYTKSYDALHNARKHVYISGNQALITTDILIRHNDSIADVSKMEWEVTGTADVVYDSDTLFSYSDEGYPLAVTYCLITANSPGTVNVKGTFTDRIIGKTSCYTNFTADENGNFSENVDFSKPLLKTLTGDADGDGEFKVNDLVSLKNWIVGKGEIENWKNADMNDDGIIDVFDFCLMRRELLKLYPGDNKILSVDLTAGMKSQSVTGTEADEEFVLGQTEFALNLFKNTVSDKENILISPYSVMQALAMTANGADNNTKAQMEKVLGGMPIEKLNEYLYTQRIGQPNDEKCKLSTANSIWYRNGFNVLPEFLQRNADYYNASAYSAPFDDTTVNDINNWVCRKTNYMIPKLLQAIDPRACMYLINAIAFDAEWEKQYTGLNVEDERRFNAFDGSVQRVRMMSGKEQEYLEDENAVGFYKYYKGGRYAFAALLPKEGMTVSEYINTLTPESLYSTLSNPQKTEVRTTMPKFGYDYDVKLNDTLSDMGMPNAFDSQYADFTKMIKSEENIYIGSVLHKTHIDVTEDGTKAAAVTAVIMKDNAAAIASPIDNIKFVDLNRPFVYCIVDTQTSLPVFIGAVNSVES